MSISYNFLNKNKLYLSANPTYLLILKFFISGKNTNKNTAVQRKYLRHDLN